MSRLRSSIRPGTFSPGISGGEQARVVPGITFAIRQNLRLSSEVYIDMRGVASPANADIPNRPTSGLRRSSSRTRRASLGRGSIGKESDMCNRLWVATILAGLLTWQTAATRADDVVRLPPSGHQRPNMSELVGPLPRPAQCSDHPPRAPGGTTANT